jgi:L-alanine-DL-glutamate epimerase-like enolase superfamily enzyme
VKIASIETRLANLLLPRSIGTSIHAIDSVGCVLVTLRTDDGIDGESFVFTINGARLRAFDEMIRGLGELVVGYDPHETGAIWHDLWREINPTGHAGVTIASLSSLDIACWDIVGRAAGLPLHKLFGACRNTVDTYASSGLWLNAPLSDIAAEAAAFIEQGFTAVKLRIGSDHVTADVERVRVVRSAIGPDARLLVDANQRFTPKDAIRLGRKLDPFDITWLEEPVAVHDLRGCAEVRAALDIPIAAGETEYTSRGIKHVLDARAADVVMPDLQRIGGYTEFRRASTLAAADDLPVSSHFFTEYSLCVAAATPNCVSVEHVDWFAPLFNESVELAEGKLTVPDRPGTGFTFR